MAQSFRRHRSHPFRLALVSGSVPPLARLDHVQPTLSPCAERRFHAADLFGNRFEFMAEWAGPTG